MRLSCDDIGILLGLLSALPPMDRQRQVPVQFEHWENACCRGFKGAFLASQV